MMHMVPDVRWSQTAVGYPCLHRWVDLGGVGKGVGKKFAGRQIALFAKFLACNVDHCRSAASVDLIARQIGKVRHDRLVHEAGASRPVIFWQRVRQHWYEGKAL